jgi:hypothetical protein
MKKYLIELGWLIGTAFISYVLSSMLSANFSVDVNLLDTYLVIDFKYFCIVFFIFLTTVVYLTRAVVTTFRDILVNVILLISNLFSMTIITGLTFFMFKIGGQTLYPPLSRLPETVSAEGLGPFFYLMLLLSISLFALNLFVGYRIYRLLKSAKKP